MQTHQIYVSNGRDRVHEMRRELFAFPEILDVFVTGRPDLLVVVCQGRPRPAEWLRALRAVGYDLPPRSHLDTHAGNVDPITVVARPSREPRSSETMAGMRATIAAGVSPSLPTGQACLTRRRGAGLP